MSVLAQAALLLGAAVVAVPLFKRLRLGAILGYLAAGVAVGPSVFGVVKDVDSILHISELGVVFFLFLVGLELEPKRLWELRRNIFGLGNAQLLITATLLLAVAAVVGLPLASSLVVGIGLALSSTAIAMQLMAERNVLPTPSGRAGFSILLFQDLAIVPILALIPLLAGRSSGSFSDILWAGVQIVIAVAALLLGGRLFTRPLFRSIANAKAHEISTAVALLIVVGAGLLMSAVGMSMAMGAFLAGVLLADSEYRHELEASIEPFKGILLGLFFMAIGMSLNLALVREHPVAVVAAVAGLVAVKFIVLFLIGRFAGHDRAQSVTTSLSLSQGGEFAFVLFGVAATGKVISAEVEDFLNVVVSASMAAVPLLFLPLEKLMKMLKPPASQPIFDAMDGDEHPIIIAGLGRYGQIIARVLALSGFRFTALEVSPEQVDFLRKFGSKLYYGDASRLDLLRAAKTDKARAFILAIDDMEASMRTAMVVKKAFPHVPIYARARNRAHAFRLMDLGVQLVNRELLFSSLHVAERVLVDLGLSKDRARKNIELFRERDEDILQRQHAVYHDEEQLVEKAKTYSAELQAIFEEEMAQYHEERKTNPTP